MLGCRSTAEKLHFQPYPPLKHLFGFVQCKNKSFCCTKHWEQFFGLEVRLPHLFGGGRKIEKSNSCCGSHGLGKAHREVNRSSREVGRDEEELSKAER